MWHGGQGGRAWLELSGLATCARSHQRARFLTVVPAFQATASKSWSWRICTRSPENVPSQGLATWRTVAVYMVR